jgi:phage protein D/phage baseplate assembly protein gpV
VAGASVYYAPDFSVSVEGLTLAADVRSAVTSLTYDNNLDTADMFTLQLNNADLRLTDSALFDVGKTVEIRMGYVGALEPMMLGEITAVSPSFPASGAPTLTVTGYDKSHRMRHNIPPYRVFGKVNDSLVAAQIAAENLLIPVIDPSPMPRQERAQDCSDWALLQQLADRNAFQVYVYWDKLYFRFPRPQTEMVVLEWGQNLSSFSPRLSTSGQAGLQIVRGYDATLAQTIVAVLPAISLGSDLDDIIERLGIEFVQQLVSLGRHVVRHQPVNSFLEAHILAKSILQQLLEGLFEGTGNCIGIPQMRAGEMVDIRGIGKRFSGNYRLSRVTHTIDEGGYQTSFEVTQKHTSTLLQSLRQKISETPSPNRQEKVEGVMIGTVVKNFGDPDNQGRVQLTFPYLSDGKPGPWARVATLMAGSNQEEAWGAYFLPDIQDRVLVAFQQGDINNPIVIGTLWNGRAQLPETNRTEANPKKLIRTKTGMQLLFDETAGGEALTISDATGAQIALVSKQGSESITLQDAAGAIIKLDTANEDIIVKNKAGSTITLKSDGTVTIRAEGNLELTAPNGNINMQANNVNVKVSGIMDVKA